MRYLAARSLAFALPLLLALFSLELGLRRMPNSYSIKKSLLAQQAENIEVLVLGASEALQGVDPSHWRPIGFNLANVGQDPRHDLALVLHWAPRLPRLKMVVLPVSYSTLELSMVDGPEAWRQHFYTLFMGLPAQPAAKRWNLRNHSAILLYEPLPSLKYALAGFKGDAPEISGFGFQGLKSVPEDILELKINALTARKRVAYHHGVMKPSEFDANVAKLDSVLRMLVSRGVRAVLLIPPVSPPYAEACDPQRRERMLAALTKLSLAHGVMLKDYFSDPRFEVRDFNDPNHLSSAGAERFTKIIAEEVIHKELR
jgi:hypothetical protein